MTNRKIRKTIYLNAPQARVWEFLTKTDLLRQWFHPADKDLAEGADYLLSSQKDGERMCWGRVEVMRPVEYMKWAFTVGPLAGRMTTVEWWLEPVPGGTRLRLEHGGLPEHAEGFGLVLALDKGWHGFLAELQQLQPAMAVA